MELAEDRALVKDDAPDGEPVKSEEKGSALWREIKGLIWVLLAVLATPSITLCAALSSRRGGRFPPSLLAATYGDTSGLSVALIFGWIVLWPLLAAVAGAGPIGSVVHHGPAALPQLVVALVLLPSLLAGGLAAETFAP